MEECARLGPLLGGLPGCDGACNTLSRIVRSIACSDLRRHLEAKERRFQVCSSPYLATAAVPTAALIICHQGCDIDVSPQAGCQGSAPTVMRRVNLDQILLCATCPVVTSSSSARCLDLCWVPVSVNRPLHRVMRAVG